MNEGRSQRRPWQVRDAVLALAGGFATSIAAYVLVGEDPTVFQLAAIVFPAQWAGTLVTLAVLARRRIDPWRELRLGAEPRDAWGVPLGALIQVSLSGIAYVVVVVLLGGDAPRQEVIDTASSALGGAERILIFVGIGVVGPLAEELVFRGVLLRALEPRGRRRAIVGSAVGFAAVHLLDPRAIIAVPFLFVLGVVLAHRTLTADRIGPAFAIHAGFNIITIVALFAA